MDPKEIYTDYVTTHFHGGGKREENSYETQRKYFRRNYLEHLPSEKKARIIDLGCGLGHFLWFLQREGYTNFFGIDVARECIEHCQTKNFPVLEGDILPYLQSLDEPVDVFILNDVLEHQSKEQMWKLVRLIQEKLAPEGVFLVKVPNMGHPLLGSDSRYLDITHEVGFNEDSFEQVLLRSGFVNVQVLPLDIYIFDSIQNEIAKAVTAILNRIFYIIFKLYGRTETTIFTKSLLGVAKRK